MKARLSIILALGGFSVMLNAAAQGPAQRPAGPDEKGAVLFNPLAAPVAAPTQQSLSPSSPPKTPDYVVNMIENKAAPEPARRGLPQIEEEPDINRDLAVHPKVGNWMIMVMSYPGKNGPLQARKMCLELREKHKVPAYIFSYGAEERRKEYERVKKLYDQQQEFFRQSGLTPNQPLRLRFEHIEVHHAVLMGGYADIDAGNAALKVVRTWPQPDEKRVDLETKYFHETDAKNPDKILRSEAFYVNPFKKAFVCRNPTVKEKKAEPEIIDIAMLRKINAQEQFSLFNCQKPYTLAVKEFQTTTTMVDRATPNNIWDPWANKLERLDPAALSAHNLAETLRKQLNMNDVYVLHGKWSSTVTVGAFTSADDPALKSTQEILAAKLNHPALAPIQFFHRPVPMAVPR